MSNFHKFINFVLTRYLINYRWSEGCLIFTITYLSICANMVIIIGGVKDV